MTTVIARALQRNCAAPQPAQLRRLALQGALLSSSASNSQFAGFKLQHLTRHLRAPSKSAIWGLEDTQASMLCPSGTRFTAKSQPEDCAQTHPDEAPLLKHSRLSTSHNNHSRAPQGQVLCKTALQDSTSRTDMRGSSPSPSLSACAPCAWGSALAHPAPAWCALSQASQPTIHPHSNITKYARSHRHPAPQPWKPSQCARRRMWRAP